MELQFLLFAGALSGLVSVLGHTVIASAWGLLRSRATVPHYAATLRNELLEVLLHVLTGILLAFLFWLSWGLAALVHVPWWLRGMLFGGLCWLALVLPTAASLAVSGAAPIRSSAATAMRWATTCLIAGLSCAWSWGS